MAIFDRMRKMFAGGRRPEEEQQPGVDRVLGWNPNPPAELSDQAMFTGGEETETGLLDRLEGRPTNNEMEARQEGTRMGIQSLMEMAGVSDTRRKELAHQGRKMNRLRLAQATITLMDYRNHKAQLNKRVINSQQWWKLKNWEQIEARRQVKGINRNKSNTGWLWNCIVGKHADAMDSYPEPIFLPRAEDDKEEAEKLTKIIPVEMEINNFEQTYNDEQWQKFIEGTGVYGVFWNTAKLNGLGDVEIEKVNILNLYWEPGITDIQRSRNVFYVSFEDKDLLLQQYPQLEGHITSGEIPVDQYRTEAGDVYYNKAAVVDWYYKVRGENGREVLHYCKYVNEICLYSSEEEGLEEGFYEDGLYPFVLDPLYPVEGSPAGYGYIDIASDTQADIDQISQAMVLNATMKATPRYFERMGAGINEQEFMDLNKPIIHVQGGLGQDVLQPWQVPNMGNDVHNMLQQKIDEIKFITGNTDVNNGGVPTGVTAASAIAALKEESGRSSKDSNKAGYRAYKKVVAMVKSRVTQFFDIQREFRIIGADGSEQFTFFSNEKLKMQRIPTLPGQEEAFRVPEFDIEIRAQRENAYTTMSQNELALQFWNAGLLNPQMADQALMVIDMMEFRGKDKLIRGIREQGTLRDMLQQIGGIAMGLAQKYDPAIAQQLGAVMQGMAVDMGAVPAQAAAGEAAPQQKSLAPDSVTEKAHDANESSVVRRARERAVSATRPA